MANNKSKDLKALLAHVGAYTLTLGFCTYIGMPDGHRWSVLYFIAVNGLAHLATDFVTSKLTSHFWEQKNEHGFFATIGADQFLHTAVLILTAHWWVL